MEPSRCAPSQGWSHPGAALALGKDVGTFGINRPYLGLHLQGGSLRSVGARGG